MKKQIIALLLLSMMIMPLVSAMPKAYLSTQQHNHDSPVIHYNVVGAFSNEQPLGTCQKYVNDNGFTQVYCKKIWFNTKEVVRVRI